MRTRRFLSIYTACFLLTSALSAQDLSNAILAKSDTAISSVAWNNDGKMFATTWNNSIILWDAESNTVLSVYSGHAGPVKKVKFSKDDKWLLSVGQDNTVIVRNLEEPSSSASKMTGNGFLPIRDAVFVSNGYSLMVPLDGFNTTYCFRLMLTGQFIAKSVVQSTAPVYSLDINDDGSLLLVGLQDGTVQVVDVATSQMVSAFPRYTLSQVPPVFTPDGRHFLSAADKNNLVISPVGGNGAIVIRDSDLPVNSAVVNDDGTMVAAALKNGTIKVYDILTGEIIYKFMMPFSPGDVVNALAFSPDGEFLVAGTEAGYILRWSITGKVFVPIKKSYENEDLLAASMQYDENGRRRGNFEQMVASTKSQVPENQLAFEAGFSTLTSDDYVGSINLDIAYRNYHFYPFYWGVGVDFGLGIPSSEFTYSYTLKGEPLSSPYINSFVPFVLGGLSGYLTGPKLLLFAEFSFGPSIRLMSTNDFGRLVTGDLYIGLTGDFMTGVQWKFLRASVGVEYDSNWDFMIKGNLGAVIRFKNRIRQEEKPITTKENTPLGKYADDSSAEDLLENDSADDHASETEVVSEEASAANVDGSAAE